MGLRNDGLMFPWGFFLANVSTGYTSHYCIFKEAELVVTAFVEKGCNGQTREKPLQSVGGFYPRHAAGLQWPCKESWLSSSLLTCDLESKVKGLEKSEYYVDNYSGFSPPKITFKCVTELIEGTIGLFTAAAHS